jgi:hypothetical protein
MADIDIDIKKELKELRQKVRQLDNVFDYNTISYGELVPFLLKIIRKFDRRLDAVEARLDTIDKPLPV